MITVGQLLQYCPTGNFELYYSFYWNVRVIDFHKENHKTQNFYVFF